MARHTNLELKHIWTRLLSFQRFGDDNKLKLEDEIGRSQFQKDIDRIVFSRPFRRLARKTQVHPMARNDHMHTRLTHSIEVANVGKTLGMRLGAMLARKNVLPDGLQPYHIGEIVQAACYVHDIGNTPFGHAGEEAIKEYLDKDVRVRFDKMIRQTMAFDDNMKKMKDSFDEIMKCDTNFEGNAQGLRIITKLQHNYLDGGLRLTYATLGAFLKYPCTSECIEYKGKFNAFDTEKEILCNIAEELGLLDMNGYYCRHPLVYLVEAADDLCNRIMDLEDGVEAKLLDISQFQSIFSPLFENKLEEIETLGGTDKSKMEYIRAKVISKSICAIIDTFMKNHENILRGKGLKKFTGEDECAGQNAPYVNKDIILNSKCIASVFINADNEVKNLYGERRKVELEAGSFFVLETILNSCLDSFWEWIQKGRDSKEISRRSNNIFKIMGNEKPEPDFPPSECFRRCIDFVAGMTDEYATYLSKQLCGAGR